MAKSKGKTAEEMAAIAAKRTGKGNRKEKLDIFVEEYLANDFNGTAAALAAGYAPNNAKQQAYLILRTPYVKDKLEKAMAERLARARMTGDEIIQRLEEIVCADPTEVVRHVRCACRYCWGKDFRFHCTTSELRKARAEHDEKYKGTNESKRPEFDEQGGEGFDPYGDPNPECPECHGQGVSTVYIADMRDLSPSALALVAGVKQTRDGLEVKMHDKQAALLQLGRAHGIFKDNVDVTSGGEKIMVVDI